MLEQVNAAVAPGAAPSGTPASLAGLDRAGLAAALGQAGVPEKQVRMRVAQLWYWIYVRGASSFDEMSNVYKDLRAHLAERFTLAVQGRVGSIA